VLERQANEEEQEFLEEHEVLLVSFTYKLEEDRERVEIATVGDIIVILDDNK
jgi:hypothetical protein